MEKRRKVTVIQTHASNSHPLGCKSQSRFSPRGPLSSTALAQRYGPHFLGSAFTQADPKSVYTYMAPLHTE